MSSSPEIAFQSEPGASTPNASAAPAPARELEQRLVASVVGKTAIARLPAVPIIVDRALAASRKRDLEALREWLALDPFLVLRVLEAGGATGGRSFDARLAALEPTPLASLLVSAARYATGAERATLTAAELGGFWLHSLRCAFLARALACACDGGDPQEAYLAGLLHDFGSFALLGAVPNTYRVLTGAQGGASGAGIAENAGRLGTIHARIGAALLEPLGLPFYLVDALLLHHAPKPELEGTHALVRIVRSAETLSQPRLAHDQLGSVAELLGISPAQVAGADREAVGAMNAVLERLNIAQPAAVPRDAPKLASVGGEQQLTETLVLRFVKEAQQPEAQQPTPAGAEDAAAAPNAAAGAWEAALPGADPTLASIMAQVADEALRLEARGALAGAPDTHSALAAVLPLTGAAVGQRRALVFEAAPAPARWPGWLVDAGGAAPVELELILTSARSLVARAAREALALVSFDEARPKRLVGFDLQVARLLGGDDIAVLPLRGSDPACRGVVVFGSVGMGAARLAQDLPLLGAIVDSVSQVARGARSPADDGAAAERLRKSTRRLVHEARNPLTVLKTSLELARRRTASGETLDKELEIADQELERVARLLDEIGRPEAQVVARSAPVDVNRVAKDLLLVYADALFTEKGIAVSQELDEAMPPLACDTEGLKQVLLNLLKNASEASPRGGRVTLRSTDNVNWEGRMMVELLVADTGAGMSAAKVASLFAAPREDVGGGRGLGLPTSLAIVQRMQGHLVCRSRPGSGSSFSVLLPRDAEGGTPAESSLDFYGAGIAQSAESA